MNDCRNARVRPLSLIAALLVAAPLAYAQSPTPPAKKMLSDSPYSGGPPPITGGFTDTSQGGTRTSGDPAAAPPGVAPAGKPEATPAAKQ